MRTFYLYQINDFCADLYKKYPYRLYQILKDIYYTSKYNQPIAINSYPQIVDKFCKEYLHNYLFQYYKLDLYYHAINHMHIISNHKENTKLFISSYSLKLKTNLNNPSFFKSLNDYNSYIFVCDFENQDYFWLSKALNFEKNLVI